MRRRILVLLLCGLLSAASAAADSIRFGSRLVKTGDPVGRVLEVAGQPDHVAYIENHYGALLAERWEYYFSGYNAKTVFIVMRNGRVTRIDIHRH